MREYHVKGDSVALEDLRYTEDGLLIVSETHKCPLFEKTDQPCNAGWIRDCFFCKYADFRTPEFIRRVESDPQRGAWYSVCHHEENRKKIIDAGNDAK